MLSIFSQLTDIISSVAGVNGGSAMPAVGAGVTTATFSYIPASTVKLLLPLKFPTKGEPDYRDSEHMLWISFLAKTAHSNNDT